MISKAVEQAFNEQFNKELASAYIYAAMAADFESKNYSGFARWMTAQAKEEVEHAQKFYHFLLERGGRPLYDTVEKPQESWASVREVFEHALKHERFITKSIDELVNTARKHDDKASEVFLQWFVSEQIEEESTVESILAKFDLAGEDNRGLYLLDKELGARG